MSVALITLAELKAQVHVTTADTSHDADLNLGIAMASAIILKKIKEDDIPDEWYSEDSPPVLETPDDIKAVALLMAAELYANKEASEIDLFTATVEILLQKYYDPPLA